MSFLNDDWHEYRSRQNKLVGRKNRRVYQLGDRVNVRVIKVDVLPTKSIGRDRRTGQRTDQQQTTTEPIPVSLSVS